MKKSQALVIQFILFFSIGLSFFLLTGNLFRFQSDLIKRDIVNLGSDLTSKHLSALAITTVDSCKTCDNISIRVELRPVASYYPTIALDQGIKVFIEPENKIVQSSIHNLYQSLAFTTQKVSSVKPITLTYDKTKNNLVVK